MAFFCNDCILSANFRNFLIWFILLALSGCRVFHPDYTNQQEIAQEEKIPDNPEISRLIEQLASPKFFEYTQAARNLITRGIEVLPYLSKNLDIMRESNNTLIPVCSLVIDIILQEQSDDWLQEQQKKCQNLPIQRRSKLCGLYEREWQRRKQSIEFKYPQTP